MRVRGRRVSVSSAEAKLLGVGCWGLDPPSRSACRRPFRAGSEMPVAGAPHAGGSYNITR